MPLSCPHRPEACAVSQIKALAFFWVPWMRTCPRTGPLSISSSAPGFQSWPGTGASARLTVSSPHPCTLRVQTWDLRCPQHMVVPLVPTSVHPQVGQWLVITPSGPMGKQAQHFTVPTGHEGGMASPGGLADLRHPPQ